jgi:hypothetical protein
VQVVAQEAQRRAVELDDGAVGVDPHQAVGVVLEHQLVEPQRGQTVDQLAVPGGQLGGGPRGLLGLGPELLLALLYLEVLAADQLGEAAAGRRIAAAGQLLLQLGQTLAQLAVLGLERLEGLVLADGRSSSVRSASQRLDSKALDAGVNRAAHRD